MRLRRIASLLAGTALIAAVTGLNAAHRSFVASYGLDTNPCTLAAPCRGFQAAVNVVDPGGEVVALDSAGYGTMTINKAVQVIVPPGVHAGITAGTLFNGVTVNAGASDVVTLRGLHLTRADTFNSGILFVNGAALFVENCVIEKFSTGIEFQPAAGARLSVKGTVVRNSGFAGIFVGSAGGVARAVIEDSWLENDQTGVDARGNSNVLVRGTVAIRNSFAGFVSGNNPAGQPARLTVENSVVTQNVTGIRASASAGGTTVVVSNNLITDNTIAGLTNDGGTAAMESRGNNTVRGNGANTSGAAITIFGGL
jgi:hypothetical protein